MELDSQFRIQKVKPAQQNRTGIYNKRSCARRRPLRPGAKRQLQLRCGAGLLRCGAASRSRNHLPGVHHAPCAALLRRGAAHRVGIFLNNALLRHAQLPCALAQVLVKLTIKKGQQCAMRSLVAPWRSLQL
ncbi:hypothetical protein L195_g059662 [Trifolium pratense]|uniref:Uncharacterized protein n=1 Tax=Trifolium pratense TaxID=57577 RepID=A0A2K3JZD6_TRIPR|nr:hypothetical protein L195_g059662 [Trifolium pratense]